MFHLARASSSALVVAALTATFLGGCKKSSAETEASAKDVAPVKEQGEERAVPQNTNSSVAGTYNITSSSTPPSGKAYTGSVEIGAEGEYFALGWTLGSSERYRGVGIVKDKVLGVGWGTGSNYGVVVYDIDGGSLKGVWASSQTAGKLGSEVLEGSADLTGEYRIVSGSAPGGGKSYTGTVTLTPSGELIQIAWVLKNGQSYRGTGVKKGNQFIVGWGIGGGAGVVVYDVAPDKLNGVWGGPKYTKLGTEVLSRKK